MTRSLIHNQKYIISHLKVITSDIFNIQQKEDYQVNNLQYAIDWLKKAQDINSDGGVSAGYSFKHGWLPSYPETTGYIIPTFINYYHFINKEEYLSRAIKMADWLLAVQFKDGSIRGLFGNAEAKPAVFNTGQVLQGLIRIYKETQKENYLKAAAKAANWLVENQDKDGAWRKYTYNGIAHVYNTRVAWPLLEIYKITSEKKYMYAATNNIQWALGNQESNGWFRNNSFESSSQPVLHTIAYAIEGLLECSILMDNNNWLEAAIKPADTLLKSFEMSGSLSGAYNKEWE